MNDNLKKFKVIPSIVKADEENEITIKSIDGIIKFYDDITYKVEFIPQDFSDVPIDKELSLQGYNKERKEFLVKPVDGEIKIKYYFANEQEWKIHISTEEYDKYLNPLYKKYIPYWNGLIEFPKRGITLSVYSLYEDLYSKKVMRGDLHIHSYESDGQQSPEMVAACYRKDGRDFIALTDHHIYNASKDAKEKLAFAENFKIMCGEEIHNKYAGFFHMVNIGSNYSVNDIYLNNKEKVEREVKELEKEIEELGSKASKADAIRHNLSKNISINRDSNPAYYDSFSKRIEDVLRQYKDRVISDAEYLQAMKDILADFRANKSGVTYPEAVKQNVHAQAFYGVILPIINEVADFDINLIGEVALDIADIIERCTKVDWENNVNIHNEIAQEIDDLFWSYEKKGLKLPYEQVEKIIENV